MKGSVVSLWGETNGRFASLEEGVHVLSGPLDHSGQLLGYPSVFPPHPDGDLFARWSCRTGISGVATSMRRIAQGKPEDRSGGRYSCTLPLRRLFNRSPLVKRKMVQPTF